MSIRPGGPSKADLSNTYAPLQSPRFYASAKQVFVDPTNGSDTNGGRAFGEPVQTLAAAYTAAASGGEIVLAPGAYSQPAAGVVLAKNTSIRATPRFDKTTQPGAVISITGTVNPAFTIDSGCGVEGVELWYPNQACASGGSPTVYPPALVAASNSKGAKIKNILARNPYQLLDLSASHGQYDIDTVKGFPLSVGLIVDRAADLDRISGLDFNPAYLGDFLGTSILASYQDWVFKNGSAQQVKRADYTKFNNCYSYGYLRGWWFLLSADGTSTADNVQLVACDVDGSANPLVADYGRDIELIGCSLSAQKYNAGLTGTSGAAMTLSQTLQSIKMIGGRFLDCDKGMVQSNGPKRARFSGVTFRRWAVDGTGTYAALNVLGNTTASVYSAVGAIGCDFEAAETGQTGNLVKGVTLDGGQTQHRARVEGCHFRGIGNVGVQAFSGSDNYAVTNNTFEDCALDTAFQGTPTNTLTTGNLHVAA